MIGLRFWLASAPGGAASAILYWGFHTILGLDVVVASVLSGLCGYAIGFPFQKRWTFRHKSQGEKAALERRYYAIKAAVFLSLELLGIYVLVHGLYWNYLLAYLVVHGALLYPKFNLFKEVFTESPSPPSPH